ncbi:CLUMA_CG000488, isoform A [Clunio marinus]|uniref:CLUMA_CG000488, isoform A n=1 Tax=Clunio marinus TaxID=568069 RepID=A0A1J1HGW4_9DIPT|nr:CLUMA_CG000488, isoform A [Clunio marinus]
MFRNIDTASDISEAVFSMEDLQIRPKRLIDILHPILSPWESKSVSDKGSSENLNIKNIFKHLITNASALMPQLTSINENVTIAHKSGGNFTRRKKNYGIHDIIIAYGK